MPGRPHTNGTGNAAGQPDPLILELAAATVEAVEATGGFAGGVYLRPGPPGLLRLAALAGLPARLFRPWWRMHINRPFPVAESFRSGNGIHLADAEDAMRRFPQLMAGLPFPFGSLYEPVTHDREAFGVLVVLRAATPGRAVDPADRRRMRRAALALGERLALLAGRGTPVAWDDPPVNVQLPARATPPIRTGHLQWDPGTGALAMDGPLRTILGATARPPAPPPAPVDPAARPADAAPGAGAGTDRDPAPGPGPDAGAGPGRPEPGGVDALAALLAPEDAYGLWTLARQVADPGRPRSRRIWLRALDGRPCLLEVTRGEAGLHGALVEPGAGPVVAAGADRLPDGVCSLDRLGRIMFASRGAETLLGRGRPELVGQVLWDALPWFGRPAYEDHFRAALLSAAPVHFLAQRDPDGWLSVSLYPGHEGVTMTLGAAGRPAYTPGSVAEPGAGLGSPADRASLLYRPVALAIALTEAVTARQVSAVVTEELLPAFGGRQLAIYLLDERHMHLAWETGFPQGFLDRFDGVPLDARLPGVETLTTGRPIFFESMQRLAAAYPGIPMDAHVGARAFLPLIASGRPVGSCILGFDQPRGFSPEERTVLTALAGLIAQALERARRYDSEAALARGLQDALLPHRLPPLPGVDTAGRYLPGTRGMEVGGDWYDVIDTGRGIALVIGDVQGHGVAAAATMGQLRSALRAFALSGHDPQEVMSGTNRLLIDLDAGQFATCCYIVLDVATGVTLAVRAGHLPPLLRHPDGTTEVLDLPGGVVLGIDARAAYPVTRLRMAPGDVLALYTDGLVERPGTDIDVGIERLRRTLAGIGTRPLADSAERLIREASPAGDRPDDIALLLASRTARGGGSPSRTA
ncbi:SpoIIE family protein phosphatase [Streptomyces lavendofoliae]|uniref:protein-serine/threonine phosphatase n=1 Tax=Streptomyces lavendofoliae TaxID=67314 RepID=A0A918HZE5_9ACTN|nr:SpoIIE family protein phosphatase [Streptomyces lavendofoliae]GGU39748.1 diguanylate cyclase [Streptomyces lavendofoliae]